MIDLSDKTCLVFDNGLFTYLAERLARDFGRVQYYCPWKVAMPKYERAMIGKGMSKVERVEDFWDNVEAADIIVFPDILDGDLQTHLRSLGKRVWGGGRTDKLESNRWEFRKLQARNGMSTPETHRCEGMTQLREFLQENDDLHVKVDKWRGDVETFHHVSYATSEDYLDNLEDRLGPGKESVVFIAEKPDGEIEVGYDGFCIDGQYPEVGAYGYEVKDNAYIGKICPYKEIPEVLRTVNSELAPILQQNGMRGFLSTEVRVRKNKSGFLLDPCMRLASPPGEALIEAYKNFSEIIWEGADGNLVVPEPIGNYIACLIAMSNYGDKNWMALEIDKDAEEWIKVVQETRIGDRRYFVPEGKGIHTIAAVCAIEDTIEAAIQKVKDRSEMIRGFDVSIDTAGLDTAMDYINEGKQLGVGF